MTALHESAGLLQHHIGHLHVPFSRLIESRSHHFSLYAAAHISNLLRTLVDKKDDLINLRVIIRNGICYRLEQHGFTSLRLSHDKTTLTLSDRSEHIHDTARQIMLMTMSEKIKLLIREKWSQEIKRNPVPDELRTSTVDIIDLYKREILVTISRRSDLSGNSITILQSIILDLTL